MNSSEMSGLIRFKEKQMNDMIILVERKTNKFCKTCIRNSNLDRVILSNDTSFFLLQSKMICTLDNGTMELVSSTRHFLQGQCQVYLTPFTFLFS